VEKITIPAGTVVKINGIPLELTSDTEMLTHRANAELIRPWFGEPKDETPRIQRQGD